ncbi:PQQ-dependent sugar dehydrogenase [Pantoea ananatis]|uniref:PQQ-dependent sugar dehydrogenase n=1 Tax=Pantoea ananas TaxID=553 RepID=UPI0039B86BFB
MGLAICGARRPRRHDRRAAWRGRSRRPRSPPSTNRGHELLPDGTALVSEKGGTLKRIDPVSGHTGTVSGVPTVAYGGQGGLGDVLPHPQPATAACRPRRCALAFDPTELGAASAATGPLLHLLVGPSRSVGDECAPR